METEKVFLYDKDGARFVPEAEAKVSVFDHGILYGDGVFEGIRIYNSRIFKFNEHLDRLFKSASEIKLQIPLSKEELSQKVIETCRQNKLKESGYIRLVVTRGRGDLGLNPKKCPVPTIFVIAKSIQMYPKEAYENGLKVIIAESARVPPRSLSANVKSLNYLNNINAYNEMLAYNENNKTDANEAVMLDYDGFIAECTGDNFFMVGFDPEKKRYYIYTPGKRNCLQGITRDVMREICKDQHVLEDYHETDIHPKDLKLKAREIFLTGTAAEIAPVVKVLNAPLGDHKYGELIIGDGKPGPWTKLLREKFIEYTRQPENSTGIYE